MAAKMILYPNWGQRVLRDQSKRGTVGPYERYAVATAVELSKAAQLVFRTFQHKDNELETSEFTPPKYVHSFEASYNRLTFIAKMANTDPGWYLVEWGSHPGGGSTRVLRYKPLTRSLLIVGARFRGR